jgi:hypothetical protein
MYSSLLCVVLNPRFRHRCTCFLSVFLFFTLFHVKRVGGFYFAPVSILRGKISSYQALNEKLKTKGNFEVVIVFLLISNFSGL